MSCLTGWDDDQQTDIVYNLWACDTNEENGGCGMIYKETPTAIEGKKDLWIPPTLSSLQNSDEIDKWVKDYKSGFIS